MIRFFQPEDQARASVRSERRQFKLNQWWFLVLRIGCICQRVVIVFTGVRTVEVCVRPDMSSLRRSVNTVFGVNNVDTFSVVLV